MYFKELLLVSFLVTGLLSSSVCLSIDSKDVANILREYPTSWLGGLIEIVAIVAVNSLTARFISLPTAFLLSILIGAKFGLRILAFALSVILWRVCLIGDGSHNLVRYLFRTWESNTKSDAESE
jgi:hypothetical protein